MEITKISLDVLKENPNNPRKSRDSQINLYRNLLDRFGCVFPIIVDSKYADVIVKRYRTLGKLDITLLREGKEYKWEDIKDELISEA